MANSSNSNIEHGVIVRQWKWPLRLAFWWVTIGLCVWCGTLALHWYWARTKAPDAPAAYAQEVLRVELEQLGRLEPGLFEPTAVAGRIHDAIHGTTVDAALVLSRALMNWPSFMRRDAASAEIKNAPDPGGDFVARQIKEAGDGWNLFLANTGLFAVRTATYLCALPLLGIGACLGLVDGLVARAKRKACAGHESASIYHRAKLGISFVAILGYVTYLAVPSVGEPVKHLAGISIAMAVMIRLQTTYYKKYL